ncbi:unnamed protein product [Ranitomeya imitator]|uniref:Ig-like domain-containing protein n=1 Tax=Ranitomeya imitator TaxID=111125 RepID=A0ABN9LGK6_9NEOB|nr:unnamed protein product [Ranitomeya imitator]
MSCRHNDQTYITMLWYQQKKEGGMKLIAYSTGKDHSEIEDKENKDKWHLERPDILKSYLKIKKAGVLDSAVYFCASSSSQPVTVTQDKKFAIVQAGQQILLYCGYTGPSGAYTMYWYQQRAGKGLALMGWSVSKGDFTVETGFSDLWQMKRPEDTNSSLQCNEATSEVSAVYFCANFHPRPVTSKQKSGVNRSDLGGNSKQEVRRTKQIKERRADREDLEQRGKMNLGYTSVIPSMFVRQNNETFRRGQEIAVKQDKTFSIITVGRSISFQCEFSGTTATYNVYWYQQKAGAGLQLMAYSVAVNDKTMEDKFKGSWRMERPEDRKASLQCDKVTSEESAAYFCAIVSFCQQVTVTQKDKFVVLKVGEPIGLKCEHSDRTGTYTMLWYQQISGKGLELIVLSAAVNDFTMEKKFTESWRLERPDAESSTLRRNEATSEDSAVYFCASSYHSHKKLRRSQHKTCTT